MLYPGNLHIACAGGCERQAKARAVHNKNVHGGEDCSCKTTNVQVWKKFCKLHIVDLFYSTYKTNGKQTNKGYIKPFTMIQHKNCDHTKSKFFAKF